MQFEGQQRIAVVASRQKMKQMLASFARKEVTDALEAVVVEGAPG